jgi:O-acetyl-ADP-ribose deacetylase (regulator of RNase III)
MEKQIPSDIDTKPQEVPPLVAVHSDHPTSGPPVLLDVDEHQCVSKTLSPSYITVSGLTDSISVEDIVAYFQSARCGGGTVTEVVYLNSKKSLALVGISGIDFDHKVTHKLFSTKHSVKRSQLTIKRAQHPPTTRQLKTAAYCAVYSGANKMKSLHQSPLQAHALYDCTDSHSQLQKTTLSTSAGYSHNEPQEEQRKAETITPMQHDNSTCPMPDKIPPGLDKSTATTPWPDITSSSDPFDKSFSANPFQDSMSSDEMSMPPLEIDPNADPDAPVPILSIKVEGLPEDWGEDEIECAFNNPDCGGGSITSISKDVITFQDPKVVERLVTKGHYEVMGHSFKLSRFSKEPDPLEAVLLEVNPGNTLVLHNVPNDVEDEHLCLFLGSACGLDDEEDFKISRKEGSPVILMSLVDRLKDKLANCYDSLRNSKKLLNRKTKLRVERLDPVASAIIDNIKDGKCKKTHLELYFGNKSKSGGGKLTDVKVLGKDKAVVTFSDPNSVWNVLALHPNHMKAFGVDVSLQMYHPILNPHFLSTSGQRVPSSDAKVYKHQPYNMPVSPALHAHLKKTNDVLYFSKMLKDCCATATLDIIMDKHLIVVSPSGGSEYIQYWKAACEAKVKDFQKKFREVPFDIPSAVAYHVYPVVLANTEHLGVTVSLSATGGVVLVGKKEGVDKLEKTVEIIVNENLDKLLREPLPPTVLTYIDKCIHQKLEAEHPKIVIKVDMEQGILQVSGTSASCDKFMKIIKSLAPETVDVNLTEEAVVMLATQTGRALLYSKIGQLPIGHFFTGPDGSLAHGDTARVFKLHLVAEKVQMAINVAQQLQTTIAVEKHPVPKEFFNLLQSSAWNTTGRKLQSDFIAHLTPKAEGQHVIIACDKQHLRYIKESIQTFCKENCFKDEVISLEHGEWEYLDTYSKSWDSVVLDMKSNKIEYQLPQSDQNMKAICLHGEISPVRKYTEQIRAIMGTIAKEGREISRPGIARHFLSTSGKRQLTGIGSAHRAVVHLTTLDEQNKMDQAIRSSSAHRLLCTGTAGHCKVNVMLGDLTEFHVDVIVNAANENLNHGGGIAGAISQKGGPSIQEDCVRYINSHGLLSIGEAVLLKVVGTLPCKAIVHAVGPRWRNGQANEEALLVKAVRESLKAAKNYKSVGLPAISSGIFGMPMDLCARAIMRGIDEFFKDTQHCVLSDVTIMLFEDKSMQTFISSAANVLQNVVIQNTSSALSLRATEQPAPKRSTRHGSGNYGVNMYSIVQLHRGSLINYQADVYVNTAHCTLSLKHGAVAQTLLKAGGPALQAECNQYIAQHGNIPDWGYAVTGGGNLKCKHIIHAVGSQYVKGAAEKGMEKMMTNIIAECDRLQASSVAFPAIGTGALGFPDNTVAKIMLEAISRYLQAHPSSRIQQIFLVIFMDKTHKAFQSLMHSPMNVYDSQDVEPAQSESSSVNYRSATPRYSTVADNQECSDSQSIVAPSVVQSTALQSFKTNDVNIDIIHGDITNEDCDGIVSTSSHDLTLHPFGVMGALLKKGGTELQQECTAAVQRYGHLHSSKVIVTGTGRPGGLKCRRILHIQAPHVANDLQKVVKAVLREADKESLSIVSLPAIGTGQHGFTPRVAAEGICEAIVEFSKSNPRHVKCVKVVLFQEEHYSSFSTAFTAASSKKGLSPLRNALSHVRSAITPGHRSTNSETSVVHRPPHTFPSHTKPQQTGHTQYAARNPADSKYTSFSTEDFRRPNFVHESTQEDKPSTWDPMPTDPLTGKENTHHLVDLPPHSGEYKEVSQAFHQTISFYKIKKIQRIQNPKLWSQYAARKKIMDRENPQLTQNERKLFHGCAVGAVEPINHTGFNRSYAGANGTRFGKGMYFARDASYSARYAVSGSIPLHIGIGVGAGLCHMYLARVLTGEFVKGENSMLVPPPKDPNNSNVLYDSVVDNVHNPSIFVVFYDAQAYPEYLITFD